ncbi:MAG: type III pantothenate kinase [Thermoguttaceae bacterium]|jgi:pantothenate kinase type III
MTEARSLFAVDVGNTRIKISFWLRPDARFRPDSIRMTIPNCDSETSDSSASCDETVKWIRNLNIGERACRWVVSSVNAVRTAALEAFVRELRPNDSFMRITHEDVPMQIAYDEPRKLGLDRAVAAFAGVRLLGEGVPFLVVDVGTAATIDYVDSSGIFKGGAILPGPRLSAEALNVKTSQLPMLPDPENLDLRERSNSELQHALSYPATETQSAIRIGVVYTLVGAIVSFYWQTRRRIMEAEGDPTRLTLLLSGGNAESTGRSLSNWFDDLEFNIGARGVRPPVIKEPRLVVNGLYEIATSPKFLS